MRVYLRVMSMGGCWWLAGMLACVSMARADRPIPLRLAEPAVAAAQEAFPEDRTRRESFIEAYCHAFLQALRTGEATGEAMVSGEVGFVAGYKIGETAAREPGATGRVSPGDFGYSLEVVRGMYVAGLRRARVIDETSGEWYLVCRARRRELEDGKIVTLRAWVSPVGSRWTESSWHGGTRELIVVEVLDKEEREE